MGKNSRKIGGKRKTLASPSASTTHRETTISSHGRRKKDPRQGASASTDTNAPETAGNLAVQRLIGSSNRMHKSSYASFEKDADTAADSLIQRKECACGGSCPDCRNQGETLLQLKERSDGGSTTGRSKRPTAGGLGEGHRMDSGTKHFLEAGFGVDLSGIRVHTGAKAERSAASVGARAYTKGSDLVFGRGEYRPETLRGRWLIAHEAAHAIQQASSGRERIQRVDDLTQMSITPEYAERLGDQELQEQIVTLSDHLSALSRDDVVYDSVQANLAILREEWEARWLHAQVAGAASFGAGGGGTSVYQLNPLSGLSPDLVASLPEGEIVEIPIEQLVQGGISQGAAQPSESTAIPPMLGPGVTMGGAALSYGTGLHVMTTGFQSAGPNAIGMVAFPQSQTARAGFQALSGRMPTFGGGGPILPESRILLGHTAVYARVNGQVVMIRSYAPQSLLEAATNIGPVRSGTGGVQAQIINHLLEPLPAGGRMFDIPSAQSIEYPVPRAWAQQFVSSLPEGGTLPGELYTAMPDTAGRMGEPRLCYGRNCVHWGAEMMEEFLTQQSGKAFQIGAEGGPSIIDLRSGGELAEDAARQRVLIEFMEDVAAGRVNPGQVELPGGMSGAPVVGQMPTSIKVLKIGGRVFMVLGLGISTYRIGTASEEERTKVIFEEAGGMLGGAGGAALVGGACVVFGIATEGIGLLICGLVGGVGGGLGGTYAGGKVGEAIGPDPAGAVVDAIVERGLASDDAQVRSDAVLFRGMMHGDTWSTIGFFERFAGLR